MSNQCKRYGCRKPAARVFCSAECRIAHHNSARPQAEQKPMECVQCGTEFTPTRSHQKTCSTKCRVALHRASKTTVSAKKVSKARRPSTGVDVTTLTSPKRRAKS